MSLADINSKYAGDPDSFDKLREAIKKFMTENYGEAGYTLYQALIGYDWYYARSDDPMIYRKGSEQWRNIVNLCKTTDGAEEIWEMANPPHLFRFPG